MCVCTTRRTYRIQHLVCLLKVLDEHANLSIISGAWQKLAKLPLHALHLGNWKVGGDDRLSSREEVKIEALGERERREVS